MHTCIRILLLLVLAATMQSLEAKSILVFGDSLSAAYKLNPADGWVNLLQSKATRLKQNITFINASISGETTRGGLSRLKQTLVKHRPDILILELGANDGLRGFPPNVIKQNLQQMIRLAQKQKTEILLVGVYIPPNYGKRYTEMFHNIYVDLAREYDLVLLPFLLESVGTNKTLMQHDGLHPNAKAQPVIAENVWKKLILLLEKSSSEATTTKHVSKFHSKIQ